MPSMHSSENSCSKVRFSPTRSSLRKRLLFDNWQIPRTAPQLVFRNIFLVNNKQCVTDRRVKNTKIKNEKPLVSRKPFYMICLCAKENRHKFEIQCISFFVNGISRSKNKKKINCYKERRIRLNVNPLCAIARICSLVIRRRV